jgi:hypothetical protein
MGNFPRRGSWSYRPSGIHAIAVTPYTWRASWRDTGTPDASSKNTVRSTRTADRGCYSAGPRLSIIKSRRVLRELCIRLPRGLCEIGMPDRDDSATAGCCSLPRKSVGARRPTSLGYFLLRVVLPIPTEERAAASCCLPPRFPTSPQEGGPKNPLKEVTTPVGAPPVFQLHGLGRVVPRGEATSP